MRYRRYLLLLPLLAAPGCLTVQGGEKPIHIVVDVNHKVDRQLDEFFAFEKKYDQATTRPAAPSGSGQS